MDALKDQVIVYDDVCPLCKAYTACFVRLGWLDRRTGFAEAPPALLQRLDLDRARHEIPLHDLRTGETRYGLDALFLILGGRFPLLRPLFRSKPFRFVLYNLYQLITYNRRIIAGSRSPATGFDCAPDVNRFYRWLYIGLAAGGGFWLMKNELTTAGPAYMAAVALLGLCLPAAAVVRKKLDFAGHWATMLLLGASLLRLLPAYWPLQALVPGLIAWMGWRRWALVR